MPDRQLWPSSTKSWTSIRDSVAVITTGFMTQANARPALSFTRATTGVCDVPHTLGIVDLPCPKNRGHDLSSASLAMLVSILLESIAFAILVVGPNT